MFIFSHMYMPQKVVAGRVPLGLHVAQCICAAFTVDSATLRLAGSEVKHLHVATASTQEAPKEL